MRTPDKMGQEGRGSSVCIQMKGGEKGKGKPSEREGNKEEKYMGHILLIPRQLQLEICFGWQ